MNSINLSRPGPWQRLFPQALALMSHLEEQVPGADWSFGGGTVLMLRIGHRQSKDIDLFVPDPQLLGYVNPRLSDAAEAVSTDYEESVEFIKLFLPEGEIDVVASRPLTDTPFDLIDFNGKPIQVETPAEIIAKKMWHRGNRAKGRDLFDLCAVFEADPRHLDKAAPFITRHGAAFLSALDKREAILRQEFTRIDAITPMDFDQCREIARKIITPLI